MLERLRSTETEPSAIAMIVRDRVLWAITALAALLIFWSLGGRYLWQDEAETALLGKNILMFGVPRAYDGTNLISQEASREFNQRDYLWRWSPWMQYYVAAISIGVLGPSTVAARLPFAVFGLLTVPATYVLARRLFESVWVARLSAFCLTVSVPFLLHARQSRWYAIFYLVSVVLLLCLARMVQGRRHAWLGFTAAAVVAFYTNYLTAVGFVACAAVAVLLVRRDRRFIGRLGAASLAIVLACLPGLLFSDVLGQAGRETRDARQREANVNAARQRANAPERFFDSLPGKVKQGVLYSTEFSTYLLPLPVVVLLGALVLLRQFRPAPQASGAPTDQAGRTSQEKQKKHLAAASGPDEQPRSGAERSWVVALLLFCLLYLCYLSTAPWVMFRYLSVLLPVAAILMGAAVYGVFRLSRIAGALLLVVLVCSNPLHLVPLALLEVPGGIARDSYPRSKARDNQPPQASMSFPLFGYLYEIGHPLNDGESYLIRYLQEHAGPNDIVIATYGDLPLQYYTGLQVVGGLQGQGEFLPAGPSWIILRGFSISRAPRKDGELQHYLRGKYLPAHADLFESVPFPKEFGPPPGVPTRTPEGSPLWPWPEYGPPPNSPEPIYHLFRGPPPREEQPMLVLHRRTAPAQP